MLLFLQEPTSSAFERILEKYGWLALILVLLIYGLVRITKAVWPFATAYMKTAQDRLDQAHDLIRKQLELANTRAEVQQAQFLDALKEQRVAHEQSLRDYSQEQITAIKAQGDRYMDSLSNVTDALKTVSEHCAEKNRERSKEENKK